MTNILTFLDLLRRLETSSRSFYDVDKLYNVICSFLVLDVSTLDCLNAQLQNNEKPQTHHNWILINFVITEIPII